MSTSHSQLTSTPLLLQPRLEELPKKELAKIREKMLLMRGKGKPIRIVGIDPNKGDLIFCASPTRVASDSVPTLEQIKRLRKEDILTFRYTRNQRAVESKERKYTKQLRKAQKDTIVTATIKVQVVPDPVEGSAAAAAAAADGAAAKRKSKKQPQSKSKEPQWEDKQYTRTVKAWESSCPKGASKESLDYEKYMRYVQWRNELDEVLLPFYTAPARAKTKWYTYINRRRSEDRMVNNFRRKFGGPDEVIVAFGDWSEGGGGHHMKHQPPTVKGKRFRELLRRAGYLVYLIDEYHTSKICFGCQDPHCENAPFRKVMNQRPHRRAKTPTVTCHGLVRCSNPKHRHLWNRDLNSALNIWLIAVTVIATGRRPLYLQRPAAPSA